MERSCVIWINFGYLKFFCEFWIEFEIDQTIEKADDYPEAKKKKIALIQTHKTQEVYLSCNIIKKMKININNDKQIKIELNKENKCWPTQG